MDCILFLGVGGRFCQPLETAGGNMGASCFAEKKANGSI